MTKTRDCSPARALAFTTDTTPSSRKGNSSRVLSVYITSPSRNTPSLRTTGRKSDVTWEASSHSAISIEFWMVAERAMIWHLGLMVRMRARRTSSVGPREGSCMRWTSSATTTDSFSIQLRSCRDRESAFSEVATTTSHFSSERPRSS